MIYDVGILGRYTNQNWGGCLTVLATYAAIKDMGFTAKLLKLKGHNDNKEIIYNRLCDFTEGYVNAPVPPSVWNRHFRNFLLCSDWTLHKNWFLPLDIKLFSWVDEGINKIAMASSFGNISRGYAETDYPMLASRLERFQCLSVREKYGVELCRKVGLEHAIIMPDPVFAMGRDYYARIAHAYPHAEMQKAYAAVYLLDMSKAQIDLAIRAAKKLSLEPLFLIAGKDEKGINNLDGQKYIYIKDFSESLSAWVYYIYHGEGVITNSFHGACLGYIFGKEVLAIDRGKGFSARLQDMLGNFGLDRKFIQKESDIEVAARETVDFRKIQEKISSMSDQVRAFLTDSIIEGKRMAKRIDSLPKSSCTGCTSCANICPKKCIEMVADKLTGFLYPKINGKECVDCGLCKQACPVLSKGTVTSQTKEVLCGYSLDEDIRNDSSSGGYFSELALGLLDQGNAVVYGAGFETSGIVCQMGIEDKDGLQEIRQSKYVQSEMRDTCLKIEAGLKEGKRILFCGTPCQCAGVSRFMSIKNVDVSNLYVVDFVCHSVNSPKAYGAYLEEISRQRSEAIRSVSFRHKADSWSNYCMRIDFAHNASPYIKSHKEDIFFEGFLSDNLYSRPSCAACNFKGENRYSDITLADAWGVPMACDKTRGISVAVVHTDKGMEMLDGVRHRLYMEQKTLQEAFRYNRHYKFSAAEGKYSKYFYSKLKENMAFSKIITEIEEKKRTEKTRANNLLYAADAKAFAINGIYDMGVEWKELSATNMNIPAKKSNYNYFRYDLLRKNSIYTVAFNTEKPETSFTAGVFDFKTNKVVFFNEYRAGGEVKCSFITGKDVEGLAFLIYAGIHGRTAGKSLQLKNMNVMVKSLE